MSLLLPLVEPLELNDDVWSVVAVDCPEVEVEAFSAVITGAQTEFILDRTVLAVFVLPVVLELLLLLLLVAVVWVLLAEADEDCPSFADDVDPSLPLPLDDMLPSCADCCCAYARIAEP